MTTLENQLEEYQRTVRDLQEQLAASKKKLAKSDQDNAQVVNELGLAKLIVNQSPVVLFRRKAGKTGEKPKLEYVSDNLKRFGYDPQDFMDERILFPDIVHPDDLDWLMLRNIPSITE